jgi:hypothetical protein
MRKTAVIISVAIAALVSACGQPSSNQSTATATSAPTPDPYAGMPTWARDYVGKSLAAAIPRGNSDCTSSSFVDGAHKQQTPVRIFGWGWDHTHHRAYDAVISVGADGIINGAGTTTTDRPDVVRTVPTIATPHIGYEVITTATSGQQRVYGFDQESHTVCSFGVVTL